MKRTKRGCVKIVTTTRESKMKGNGLKTYARRIKRIIKKLSPGAAIATSHGKSIFSNVKIGCFSAPSGNAAASLMGGGGPLIP